MSDFEEKVQTEISDIIEDFIPASPEGTPEVQTQEASAVEVKAEEIKPAEVTKDGEEGKERQEEAPSGQEQVGEPAKEEAVKSAEPVAEDEVTLMKKENEALKAYIEEVAGRLVTPKPKEMTPEEQEAMQRQREAASKQVLKFLPNDEVFDEVMKSSDNFNALMTSVVNTAVERSLRIMPHIATQLVEQQVTLKTAINNFYQDNMDLVPHKKYVGFIANEVTAQHPDWGLTQILQETEKEARTRLRLGRAAEGNITLANQQSGQQSARTAPTNPGFVPSGSGGRKGTASANGNLTVQEKDILNLIS
jgi:hypothetical protein